MTPAEWSHVKAVLAEAMELPEVDREAYLEAACGSDAELRRNVAELLAVEQASGGVLDEESPFGSLARPPAGASRTGERVGAYEILEEIGHGGMGVVYAARRADAAYEKTVAIKIVRPGWADEGLLARFRSERRILASLDHPNVARVLDGGTTARGEPYLVMEYVRGESLVEFCDSRRLDVPARIRLFRQVCAAVQSAHQRLIVHRDIKPGNVLVTEEGVPKLLDFGIAKLLDPAPGDVPAPETGAFTRLMTPDYASPEQILGQPITTATDIFALGVVLYELLTGRLPHSEGSEGEVIARALSSRQPERASTAARRDGHTGTAEERGQVRGETPTGLARRLRGDLDTILAKALRPEPDRRYSSAEQLSDDLGRYLSAQPVRARRGGFTYRAGKFVRRNRLAVAAAAIIALAVAGGVWATVRESRRARAAEARAERRFEDVRRLANSFVFDFHDAIRDLPGATKPRALVLSKAREYLDGLAQESAENTSLQRELAQSYLKLGDVSGGIGAQNLGDPEGALRNYRKASVIAQALVEKDADPENRRLLATAMERVGARENTAGHSAGGLHLLRARAICEELLATAPEDLDNLRCLARIHDSTGNMHASAMDLDRLVQSRRDQVSVGERLAALQPHDVHARRALALAYKKLGGAFQRRKELPAAIAHFRKALAIDETRAAREPDSVEAQHDHSFSLGSLAFALAEAGQYAEGLDGYRRALKIRQALADADPADARAGRTVASAHHKLGQISFRAGLFAEAGTHYATAARLYQSLSEEQAAAESGYGVAEAHENLAKVSRSKAQRRRWLLDSRSWYARSFETLKALEKDGKLTPDSLKPENVFSAMARCDAALSEKRGR